jgi:DNA-binding MarR family transcriptional regulator
MAKSPRTLARDRCIQLAFGIHRSHRVLAGHVAAFGMQHDLEVVHLSILHALGLHGTLRMGELADLVVIGAAGMTRRAEQLESRGLLARQRSAESQREVLVCLTKEGEDLCGRSFRHLHAAHREYFDGRLGAAEQRQLLELLAKL